jgi:hypothetical protein
MTDKSDYRRGMDDYEKKNDYSTDITGDLNDSSYVSSDSNPITVQSDTSPVDDPIEPGTSNTERALGMFL